MSQSEQLQFMRMLLYLFVNRTPCGMMVICVSCFLLYFFAAEINEISTIAYSVVFCFRVEAKILINFYLVGLDGCL